MSKPVKGLPAGSTNDKGRVICGAWTKQNKYCQRDPEKNGRCIKHGGSVVPEKGRKSTTWKLTASLYSQDMSSEERDLYQTLEIGTLEQELRLLRIQLRRALKAQNSYDKYKEKLSRDLELDLDSMPDGAHKHLEIESYEKYLEGDVIGRRLLRRKKDYSGRISNLLNTIGRLEARHHDLMQQDIPDSERIAQISRDLRAFTEAAQDTIPEDGDDEMPGDDE